MVVKTEGSSLPTAIVPSIGLAGDVRGLHEDAKILFGRFRRAWGAISSCIQVGSCS